MCGPGIGFDFVPRSPLNSVRMPAKQLRGRSSLIANQTTSFLFVWGLGSGAYSRKPLPGRPLAVLDQGQKSEIASDEPRQGCIFVDVVPKQSPGLPHLSELEETLDALGT